MALSDHDQLVKTPRHEDGDQSAHDVQAWTTRCAWLTVLGFSWPRGISVDELDEPRCERRSSVNVAEPAWRNPTQPETQRMASSRLTDHSSLSQLGWYCEISYWHKQRPKDNQNTMNYSFPRPGMDQT